MAVISFPADAYAKLQRSLFPPGRLFRLDSEGTIYKVLLSAGDELNRVSDRAVDLMREAIGGTAVELLPDWEEDLGLVSTGTDEERQDRIVAKETEESQFRPEDVKAALAPYLALDAADVVVIETSRALAIAVGDDRAIYLFHIYRNPALAGTPDIDAAQVELDLLAHSHTKGRIIESTSLKCDESTSLCDRDLLGV